MYRHTGMLVAGIQQLDGIALRHGFRLQACRNDEIYNIIFNEGGHVICGLHL